ncbi:MAG: hypothetical protein E6G97_02065 [Alphaproteobacteria bacterium]|nr:MAG: hypothetical protein E6G97_02065 [Alphaproteobacteria bacterium]
MSGDFYRLTFTLPATLRLGVLIGRHQPCLHGCVLRVDEQYQVAIEGQYRVRVFDQARTFLRVHSKGHGELKIRAVMKSPARIARGSDTVWIVIGAAITFSESAIEPDIGVGEPDALEELLLAAERG